VLIFLSERYRRQVPEFLPSEIAEFATCGVLKVRKIILFE